MAKKKPAAISNGDGTDMAVADPPKRGRGRPPKQPLLNNDPAFERIKEIEDVASAYVTARDERLEMLKGEIELKKKLVAVMKKYDLNNYSYDGYMIEYEHIDEDEVKVKKKKKRAAKSDGSLA